MAIEQNIKCFKCGYNLRGLDHDAICPECASAVALTLSQLRLQAHSNYPYVKWWWLIFGLIHIVLGPAAMVLFGESGFWLWVFADYPVLYLLDIVGVGGPSNLFGGLLIGGTLMYAGIGLVIGWLLSRKSSNRDR